ncbi:MAG: PhnD/SsuA/transferrin family substrate-binding protein [Candidatus Thiodiazotropha taylori]|nr:PhnD/SsuA/transferrin family substrate-binding protein [Candidatus Thiodiazotropha taylori]
MNMRGLVFTVCFLICCLAQFIPSTLYASSAQLKLGILSFRPKLESIRKWQPLVEYIDQSLGEDSIALSVMGYAELEQAIADQAIDFVLTNPAHYVQMTFRNGLSSPLATLIPKQQGHPVTGFGGVIVTNRTHTDINHLTDLKGRTIAAVSKSSLGGFQAQAMELLRKGINLSDDVSFIETGMPHDNVINTVLAKQADAGFVRTSVLEEMADSGAIDMSELKILNQRKLAGFPFLISTEIYPEWPFAAMPHADQDLGRRVAAALLGMQHNGEVASQVGIEGFTVPKDYEVVRSLLQTLRLPPYEEAPNFTINDVLEKYGTPLVAAALMAVLILLLTIWLLMLNRKLGVERQRVIRQSEERHRILTALGDGVFGLDHKGNCSFINPAALQILSFERDEVEGANVYQLFHSVRQDGSLRPESESTILNTLEDGETRYQDDWFICKDGSGIPVQLTVAPVLREGEQRGAVVVFSDNSDRYRLEQDLRSQAATDVLTGLPNRRCFLAELNAEFGRVKRYPESSSALLMLDLDNFKYINDHYGHPAGDEVLKHFAKQLMQVSRKSDRLGRIGGEEFCLLLPVTNPQQACQIADRLCVRIAGEPVVVEGKQINYTVSIGVSAVLAAYSSVDEVLTRADQALYRAKDSGRNCVVLDSEIEQSQASSL